MKHFGFLALGLVAFGLIGCAPFPVPRDWPVAMAADRDTAGEYVEEVRGVDSVSDLTKQEWALLNFLSDTDRINEAIGKADSYGTRSWKVAEIYRVEPGREVSVLCEEGHNQEAIYFRYSPENKVWYRVLDFEDPHVREFPAVIVK